MSTAPPTVCLLDDEPSVLKALGRLLGSEGLATEAFLEPVQFLAYARNHPVRVAVLDVRMPGMSGLAVQAALATRHPQAQVIVITAEDDSAHRTVALAAGAAAFFLKPIDSDAFVAAVRAALRATE